GKFEDWSDIIGVSDSKEDQELDNINLVEYRALNEGNALYPMLSVEGELLAGEITENAFYLDDTLYHEKRYGSHKVNIYLDTDSEPTTGYDLDTIGADYMVELNGHSGHLDNALLNKYTPPESSTQNNNNEFETKPIDWHSWSRVGRVNAKAKGDRVELSLLHKYISMTSQNSVDIQVELSDSLGNHDLSDVLGCPERVSLVVKESIIAPNIMPLSAKHSPLLAIDLTAVGGVTQVQRLAFTITGSIERTELESIALYRDLDVDNAFDDTKDSLLTQSAEINNDMSVSLEFTEPLIVSPKTPARLFLTVSLSTTAVKHHSIGAKLSRPGIVSSGILTLNRALPPGSNGAFSYLGSVPDEVLID
ncbi:MAG: hypothetical protein KAJ51_06020, partial [Thermoplasmata archaeon]|nr:hypothetical protein [Thermoplasmata archaeon]